MRLSAAMSARFLSFRMFLLLICSRLRFFLPKSGKDVTSIHVQAGRRFDGFRLTKRTEFIIHIERQSPHMNLEAQLTALKEQQQTLSRDEQAKLACDLAKQFEKASEYEAACEALAEFWPDRDREPRLDGLNERTAAEVLLRVGNLAGWLGSADQTTGSQER